MKKILLILVLLPALAYHARSQVKIGPRLGFNLTAITIEDGIAKDYRTMLPGVNSGIIIDIGRDVMFSTGFLVSMQGLKFKDGAYKELFRTTYLNIPLQAKINIGKADKRISGYFILGTYGAFWIKAKAVVIYQGDKVSENYDFDNRYDNRFDVGVSAGGGINIDLGKRSIQAGPLFSMGFLDMVKSPYSVTPNEKAYLNVVLAVMNVSYMFHVGGGSSGARPKPPPSRM